jgi:hypothetical protein
MKIEPILHVYYMDGLVRARFGASSCTVKIRPQIPQRRRRQHRGSLLSGVQ